MLKRIILLLILLISCQKEEEVKQTDDNIKKIESEIFKFPIQKRLAKWDSLLQEPNFNEVEKAIILFEKSNDLAYLSRDNEAVENYEKVLIIFENHQMPLMQAKTHINLGISYAYLNKKTTATNHLIKGLILARDLDDKTTISRAYSELAHIYYLNHEKEKALEYLEKTGKMQQELNDTMGLSATYTNLAVLEKEMGNYEEAYRFTLKAIELDKITNNDIYLINSYNGLGEILLQYKNDRNEALRYYRKALSLARKKDIEIPFIYENISNLYERENQLDSAIFYLKKAIKIGSENISDNIRFYKKLTYLSLIKKNDQDVLKLVKIKDSLVAKHQEIEQEENKKDIERSIVLSNQQKKLDQAKQINKKNRIIFIFIILTFILGILISFQLNRFEKLKYKQEKYILEQKVLRSQMNPHFIFNVLSSIQNSLIENNPIKSAAYLSKFAQLIRKNFEFIKKRHISLKDELEAIENYLETQKFRYKDKFDYELTLDKNIDHENTMVPPMILQPFIENSIEHGFKNINYKGQLQIHIFSKNDKICFEITDNGTGYHPQITHKEHALDIFRRRLEIMGKEELDSFKILNLEQGTKVIFCFSKELSK